MNAQTVDNLYIVVGARRSVGAHFREALAKIPNSACIGITRNGENSDVHWSSEDPKLLCATLGKTSDDQMYAALHELLNKRFTTLPKNITLVFTVGPFDYQGHPAYGDEAKIPNPDIYRMNKTVLENITSMVNEIVEERAVKEKQKMQLNVVGLSTISLSRPDSHLFPAYAISKVVVEEFMRKFVSGKMHPYVQKGGLVLRTSTLHTGSEHAMRSGAKPEDIAYWIKPEELVSKTLPLVTGIWPGTFHIIDVLKPHPAYAPDSHLTGVARERWKTELGTGATDREVPRVESLSANQDPSLHEAWEKIIRAGRIQRSTARVVI